MNHPVFYIVWPLVVFALWGAGLRCLALVFSSIVAAMKVGVILVMDTLIFEVKAHPTLATARAGEAVADFESGWLWLWILILIVCVIAAIVVDRRHKKVRRAAARATHDEEDDDKD